MDWYPIVQNRAAETASYLAILVASIAASFFVIRLKPERITLYIVCTTTYGAICVVAAVQLAGGPFDAIRLMSFGVFLGGPLICAILAALSWSKVKPLAVFFLICLAATVAIGVDAFLVEPHDLQIVRYADSSSKLRKPIRIAILTDIQTDKVGEFERKALQAMMGEKPDMILLPGDYIQEPRDDVRWREMMKLREMLIDEKIAAPLGVYAVQGNVEDQRWPKIFEGTYIKPVFSLGTERTPGFAVTGLSLDESFDTKLKVGPEQSSFHIVLGHAPDFALGKMDADLLVAGHTHGGQVQLPFFGPVVTLSRVPKDWASGGLVKNNDGVSLVVARGVGMERGHAPRLRFLCKPEIVILDVLPEVNTESSFP